MLHGTCLGEALRLWHLNNTTAAGESSDDEDESSGPDGNGEDGRDLGLDNEDDEDNTPPGPVDGPANFSEVALALKKGLICHPIVRNVR
jgi:hypothetical protein